MAKRNFINSSGHFCKSDLDNVHIYVSLKDQ